MRDSAGVDGDPSPSKTDLRRRLIRRRAQLSAETLTQRGAALTRVALTTPELLGARCVACYVSVGSEPSTHALLQALLDRGTRVLLPLLEADDDLEWADFPGLALLEPGPRHLLQPRGPRLGRDAVRSADTVLVPALAVDQDGNRLGRGGGSYDRALSRVATATPVLALLHDGEFLQRPLFVPVESHDRPVSGVILPDRREHLPRR